MDGTVAVGPFRVWPLRLPFSPWRARVSARMDRSSAALIWMVNFGMIEKGPAH